MAKGRVTKRTVDAAKARKTDSYLWDQNFPASGSR